MNRRGFLTLSAAAAALSLLPSEVIALPNARKIFLPPRGGWTSPGQNGIINWGKGTSGYFMELGLGDDNVMSLWRAYEDGSEEILSRQDVPRVKPGDIVSLTVSSEGQRAAVNGVTYIQTTAPGVRALTLWPENVRQVRFVRKGR